MFLIRLRPPPPSHQNQVRLQAEEEEVVDQQDGVLLPISGTDLKELRWRAPNVWGTGFVGVYQELSGFIWDLSRLSTQKPLSVWPDTWMSNYPILLKHLVAQRVPRVCFVKWIGKFGWGAPYQYPHIYI